MDTKDLALQYRVVTTKLLYHLREIERRRLFSDLGYSSLFEYAVKELGFSDASANRRIRAARLLEDVPELELKIQQGVLNLSNVAKAAQLFKEEGIKDKETKREILKKIENLSSRQCDKALHELVSPKPFMIPLKITLTERQYETYKSLQAMLAHGQDFWTKVLGIALRELERQRYSEKKETTSQDPRYVTARLKKEIYIRDQVCQKCGSIYALEIDHKEPFALGGKTEAQNLRLLCRSCNQRTRIKAGL